MTTFNGYSLTYDSDGQTLTDTSNTYTWDTRRHLTKSYQTSLGSGYGTDFVYDALGRRVKVTDEAAGTTTQYLYDGLNPVALTTGSAVTNLLTGLSIDEYFSFSNSTEAASLLTDALGSTLALTDSTGAVFSTSTYEPFGRQPVGTIGLSASTVLITIPFEFTGREDDDGTNYYYRGRYYSTYLQRFLSQDPIDFAGGDTNLYAYVNNDPVTLADSLGLLYYLFRVTLPPSDLYFVLHFPDNGSRFPAIPDAAGLYQIRNGCPSFFCSIPDDQFQQGINNNNLAGLGNPPSAQPNEPITSTFLANSTVSNLTSLNNAWRPLLNISTSAEEKNSCGRDE